MNGKLCTKRSNIKHNRNLGTVLFATTDGTIHKSPSRPPDPTPDMRDTTHFDTINDGSIDDNFDDQCWML